MDTLEERWESFKALRLAGPIDDYPQYNPKVSLQDAFHIALKCLEGAKKYQRMGDHTSGYIFAIRGASFLIKEIVKDPRFDPSGKFGKLRKTAVQTGLDIAEDCKRNIKINLELDIKLEKEQAAADAKNREDRERNLLVALEEEELEALLEEVAPTEILEPSSGVVLHAESTEVDGDDVAGEGRAREVSEVVVLSPDAEDGETMGMATIVGAEDFELVEGEANVVAINPGEFDGDAEVGDGTTVLVVSPDIAPDADESVITAEVPPPYDLVDDKPVDRSEFANLYLSVPSPTVRNVEARATDDSAGENVFVGKVVNGANTVEPTNVGLPINPPAPSVPHYVPPEAKKPPAPVPPRPNNSVAPRPPPAEKKSIWNVDDKVDILDRFPSRHTGHMVEQWRPGRVIATSNGRVKVSFEGWSSKHDSWLATDSSGNCNRLAMFGRYTKEEQMRYMSKTDKFLLGMNAKNYSVWKMRGDGNCLFRSVAHQIWGDPERHAELRHAVCDHMLRHPGQFAEVLGALFPGPNGFQRYCAAMRRPCYNGQGEWGGDPEIRVMEEMIDRPFEIWDVEVGPGKPSTIHLDGSFPKDILETVEPIRISYHGKNHYNSVTYNKHKHKYPLVPLGTNRIRTFRVATEARDKAKREAGDGARGRGGVSGYK